jgi:hypothetical protein
MPEIVRKVVIKKSFAGCFIFRPGFVRNENENGAKGIEVQPVKVL